MELFMFLLFLVLVALLVTIMYLSGKGMCRFTERDYPPMYVLKHFANALTGGILGIVMFFVKGEDCVMESKSS